MKILAIRGRNLASLQGDFAIDLDEAPLSSTGLFSITGPTGAGKSTLLDALCLALFDRTPRMKGGGVPIGRVDEDDGSRLSSGDARSLLRRGTAAGHAEVDFVGSDGRRYRARWSVRRARDKAEGRFQPQTLDLRELESGEALGGTKTETLAAIEARLGLSFDQFRRSALLAQGDFAAFLKADKTERSELLERMTGTEVYREISMAAYRRAQDEERALRTLENEAGALKVLGAEERARLETDLAGLASAAETAKTRQEEVRAAQDWYRSAARMAVEEQEAFAELARAETDWLAAAGAREELVAVEAAEPLRMLVRAADAAEEGLVKAGAAVDALTIQAASAAAALNSAELAQTAAREVVARAEASQADCRPALREAAELDARLGDARRLAAEAAEAARVAEEAEGWTLGELSKLEAGEKEAADSLARAGEWLAAHPQIHLLAAEWSHWKRELERYGEGSRRERVLAGRRTDAAKRAVRAADASVGAQAALGSADERLATAVLDAARAEREATADPAGALRAERVRWESRKERLRDLADAAARAAESLVEQRELAEAREAVGQERQTSEDRAREAVARRTELGAALAEAERALTQARLALDFSSHRAELRTDEPCPLCGATAHPWSGGGAPSSPYVQAQQARVNELRSAATQLEREEAACRERASQAEKLCRELTGRLGNLEKAGTALQAFWEARSADLAEVLFPPTAVDPAAGFEIQVELERTAQRLGELRERESWAEELVGRAAKEREVLDQARDARQRAWEGLVAAEKEEAEAAQSLRELDTELEQAREIRRSSIDDLAPAFEGWERWQQSLEIDAEAFGDRCAKEVALFSAKTAEREESRQRLAELAPKLEATRAVAGEKRAARGSRKVDAEVRRAEWEELRAKRNTLLQGRQVREVEDELAAEVARASAALENAGATFARVQRELAEISGRLTAGRQALADSETGRSAAGILLEEALAVRGLGLLELRGRLAHGPDWVASRRRELEVVERLRQSARVLAEERTLRREAQAASGHPALPEGEVPIAAEAAGTALAEIEESVYKCRHSLDQDGEQRRKAEELLPRIEAHRRASELWKGLSELIGSADGNKFRTFAQSLTLDVLLGHANTHLADLSPRYRLERVPGQDLELQVVDLDMGEEVRSVNSLSGGESFLVSLALALGLSSLSSRTAQVGSLFIDEGFGSLDPDTLEVALAALDSLQSAGRQVGIISHVPGLAERIGARIQVTPLGAGRSRVGVVG